MPVVIWDNEFAYLQARIRARASALPRVEDWAPLGPLSRPEHYLQRARTTRVAAVLPPELLQPLDVHAFESALRRHLHRLLMEQTYWAPRALTGLVECCALFPYLAFLDHVRRSGENFTWFIQEIDLDDGVRRAAQGLLDEATTRDRGVALEWLDLLDAHLRDIGAAAPLHRLLRPLLQVHPMFGADHTIEGRFMRTLRIGQTAAAQVLGYSGLLLWAGLRLRGEVVKRQVFAVAEEG